MGPVSDRDEIKRSMAGSKPWDRTTLPRGLGPGRSEGSMIGSMDNILKKSIDYAMILALSGLGIMATVLMLQGFRVCEFYLDANVLTILVPSLSAAAALRVLGETGRGVMAPKDK